MLFSKYYTLSITLLWHCFVRRGLILYLNIVIFLLFLCFYISVFCTMFIVNKEINKHFWRRWKIMLNVLTWFCVAGEKARLCLPDEVCWRTAGPCPSLHQHIPASFEGRPVLPVVSKINKAINWQFMRQALK